MVKSSRYLRLGFPFVGAAFLSLILLFGFGCTNGAGNTAIIKGTVYSTSNAPLSGSIASVFSSVTSMATADSNGVYILKNMPVLSDIVNLTHSGYTPSFRKVTGKANITVWAPLAILAPLDSKTTVIDSSGGKVMNTDGSVKLAIPAGALTSATNVILTAVPLRAAPVPPPYNYQFIAVIVYITPSDGSLSSPAVLSIPNSTNLPDGTSIDFYHLNTSSLQWERITSANGTVSFDAGVINANITDFGWTAAIVPIAPNAGSISGIITDANTGNPIVNASVWSGYLSTISELDGSYLLTNSPTGDVTVEAVANGYNGSSTIITVNSGGTTPANLYLIPISGGTIEGTITNSLTGVPVSGARIVGPNGIETATDSLGKYSFTAVAAGDVSVTAYANGYLYQFKNDTLQNHETLILNFALVPTDEATAWIDDFETDRGWKSTGYFSTTTTAWQRLPLTSRIIRDDMSIQGFVTLPNGDDRLPVPLTGDYVYWFGQLVDQPITQGSYIATQKIGDTSHSGGTSTQGYFVSGDLTSPVIDITNFAYAMLDFTTWWEIEGRNPASGYDRMEVYLSVGPTYQNWNKIAVLNPIADPDHSTSGLHPDWPYTSGGYNLAGRWVEHKFNLTDYVGKQIKLKFSFNSGDNQFNGFRGWVIDNVGIYPTPITASQVSSASIDLRPDHGELLVQPR